MCVSVLKVLDSLSRVIIDSSVLLTKFSFKRIKSRDFGNILSYFTLNTKNEILVSAPGRI